ncbi:MAG: preprotein translocase subunit SecE [Candidatus Pacebacteria bacterium]|nr:preprotein translocase subunit SecE [Candidatus Paceibacterota bacterium]
MNRLISFFTEARAEFDKINWPTAKETIRMTVVVVVLSIGIAAFLGAVDYGLLYALNNYLLQ